jgi:hypothetical protein
VELFRDNWSYLKVEINWLERILLTAAAKSRKTEATFTRFAKTKGDRATHSWWEGLVSFEKGGYDSPPPPTAPKPALSYQQQLDARIQQSQRQGILLALPALCDRYSLSLFEKQTILLAMAPEVHRRYGELCGYLTGQDKVGLPTVDLALRLFCRDDRAWRQARSQLLSGKLMEQGILLPSDSLHQSFLEAPLKLAPPIVSYLLSEQPTPLPHATTEFHLLSATSPKVTPLPDTLQPHLQHTLKVLQAVSANSINSANSVNQVAQWVGLDRITTRTEKINLYHHLAQALNLAIVVLDLATLTPLQQAQILEKILEPAVPNASNPVPTLLVITTAQRWLSRSGMLDLSQTHQLIQILSAKYTWIIYDFPYPIALAQQWRSWITVKLDLKLDPKFEKKIEHKFV